MKKKLIALASLAIAFMSTTAFAQAPAQDGAPAKKECTTGDKKCCKDKKECCNPFEGLNLSDTQKAQLKALGEKNKSQCQEQKKANKQKKDANKQKCCQQKQQARKSYLESVKAILTAEQYVQFLENRFVNGGDGHKMMKQGKHDGGHHGKHMKKGESKK